MANRPWTRRNTRTGIEYGGSASQYYWNEALNPGASYDASLGTYDLALPNCTTYAFGRILEAGDPAPITGWHNANAWHAYLTNGWTYEPYNFDNAFLGDIVEWAGNGRNHVAVIEERDANNRLVYISQSFYTSDNGTASGYRSPAVWGSTKQSVSNYGIANYPNRFFIYSGLAYPYGGVEPTYVLKNPNSHAPDPTQKFTFFMKNKKGKRVNKIYV